MEEEEEDLPPEAFEIICHVCSGSGESPWGPVGMETCWKCHGQGILPQEEEFEAWERYPR